MESPYGNPTSLLPIDCRLAVRGYTAVPTETVSGGASPDKTDEFRQAANEHLPVESVEIEEHDFAPELLGEFIIAELDTDRVQLDRYMEFLRSYARLVGVEDDLRYVSVGVDPRISADTTLSDEDVTVAPLFEVEFSSNPTRDRTRKLVKEWMDELPWIVGCTFVSRRTAVIRHRGGPNDLVNTQGLDLVEEIESHEPDVDKVVLTGGVVEN